MQKSAEWQQHLNHGKLAQHD